MGSGDRVTVSCPRCRTTVHVSPDLGGKLLQCPNPDCAKPFMVPQQRTLNSEPLPRHVGLEVEPKNTSPLAPALRARVTPARKRQPATSLGGKPNVIGHEQNWVLILAPAIIGGLVYLGVLVIGVLIALSNSREWRHYGPFSTADGGICWGFAGWLQDYFKKTADFALIPVIFSMLGYSAFVVSLVKKEFRARSTTPSSEPNVSGIVAFELALCAVVFGVLWWISLPPTSVWRSWILSPDSLIAEDEHCSWDNVKALEFTLKLSGGVYTVRRFSPDWSKTSLTLTIYRHSGASSTVSVPYGVCPIHSQYLEGLYYYSYGKVERNAQAWKQAIQRFAPRAPVRLCSETTHITVSTSYTQKKTTDLYIPDK